MKSGPSATFGIMLSVTNSGKINRLTSGDQLKMTANATPMKAPRKKPPRISVAVTRMFGSQAYFADVNVASAASGEGKMKFGTWKASTRTCHSTITARCTARMMARDRVEDRVEADRPLSSLVIWPLLSGYAAALVRGSLARPCQAFNHLVD